jgi:CRP-like cAMP-binding protein
MPRPLQSSVRNRLLTAMSAEDYRLLQANLEPVPLALREVLIEPNKPIKHVHFIESGLASVIAVSPGREELEVAHVGREGLTGGSVVNGVDHTPNRIFIQVKGSAFRLCANYLTEAMEESPSLRTLLLRYMQTFLIQMAQSALANGRYTIHERLARWLLMCHDRIDGDNLPLTHDLVSVMLGVRRAGVTEALHHLEADATITVMRGEIVVRDRSKLEGAANGCYGLPEGEYGRLIGPAPITKQ